MSEHAGETVPHAPKPCECPTCRIGRAEKVIREAHDEWIEREADVEMDLSYLYDEAKAVADGRVPFPGRKRLRAAIECLSIARRRT